MGRNKELIRQWTMLQKLSASRGNTIQSLSDDLGVSTRTIRRDLEALQAAGFPIYDDASDGPKHWRMDSKMMGALARSGLTFGELAALYFSRTLLECFADASLLNDLKGALDKFEAVLSPAMKKFLDRLPRVVSAKAPHAKRRDAITHQTTVKLLEASLDQRVVTMRYYSQGSRREKDYVVHPYRLVHAQGGLYLMAFVEAYAEMRTFAVERIRSVSVQEQTFEPVAELDGDPFGNSMGVHRGPATRVRLRFHAAIAALMKERTWHRSQRFTDRADGSVVMTLDVSDDYALRGWLLGFGRLVKVMSPAALAGAIQEELAQAHAQYDSDAAPVVDSDMQPVLPFVFNRLINA
jgi:predicted DNA-binding transcriptional regulator YafY